MGAWALAGRLDPVRGSSSGRGWSVRRACGAERGKRDDRDADMSSKRAAVLGARGWRGTDLMGEEAGSAPAGPAGAAPSLARSPLLRPHSSHSEVDLLRVPEDACLTALPTSLSPPGTDVLQPPTPFFPLDQTISAEAFLSRLPSRRH